MRTPPRLRLYFLLLEISWDLIKRDFSTMSAPPASSSTCSVQVQVHVQCWLLVQCFSSNNSKDDNDLSQYLRQLLTLILSFNQSTTPPVSLTPSQLLSLWLSYSTSYYVLSVTPSVTSSVFLSISLWLWLMIICRFLGHWVSYSASDSVTAWVTLPVTRSVNEHLDYHKYDTATLLVIIMVQSMRIFKCGRCETWMEL